MVPEPGPLGIGRDEAHLLAFSQYGRMKPTTLHHKESIMQEQIIVLDQGMDEAKVSIMGTCCVGRPSSAATASPAK